MPSSVYRISRAARQLVRRLGTITGRGYAGDTRDLFERRKDLEGTVIRFTCLRYLYQITRVTRSSSDPAVEGYFSEILDDLSRVLNFTPKYVPDVDGKWGSPPHFKDSK